MKKQFFAEDTVKVAKALLGKIIQYNKTSGVITETEAYKGYEDPASHAFRKTQRSAVMYESYGKIYVYFIYGNYYCLNITTERNKPGAVLIRAVKPLKGIKIMAKRRGISINDKKPKSSVNLTNGPGKLCQAFGITKALNNTAVGDKIKVFSKPSKKFEIVEASRIGIKKAKNLKWRFYIKGSEFISKR